MAGPAAFIKQVHAPTGVTHCAVAHFTLLDARGNLPDLIVTTSSLLQLYSVREQQSVTKGYQLLLRAECQLFGVVESMAVLKNRAAGKQRDAIILAFRDAKVSVLDWDASSCSVVSTSLHSFEGDANISAGLPASPYGPRLLSDPQGRCAAVLLGRSSVAVLPAMTTDTLDEMVLGAGPSAGQQGLPTTVGNSCILRLAKHDIAEVRDAVFLHRYSEPVLLVLHETAPTWSGNLRARRDTMAATALSVNVLHKRLTLLWSAKDLPSDACRLHAAPLGGALVMCRSLIKYISQSGSCSLAVSSMAYAGVATPPLPLDAGPALVPAAIRHAGQYANNVHLEAASAASKGAPRAEGFELDLVGSQGAWVASSTLLLGLASGQLVAVSLQVDGGSVKRIKVSKVSAAAPPSCMCAVGAELIFLGSCAGDSLLLRALPEQQAKSEVLALKTAEEALKDAMYINGHDRKRQRTEPSVPGLDMTDDEDEVSLLYRTETQHIMPTSSGTSKYNLQVADILPSIGIIHDMVTGPMDSASSEEASGASGRGPPALVAAVGHDRAGALAIMQQSVVPDQVTETLVTDVHGVWAVHFFPEGLQPDATALYHAFLLVSTRSATKVLRTGEELDELSAQQADFVLDSRTVFAGNLLQASRIVQVCPGGVTVLSGSSRVQYLSVKDLGMQGRVVVTAASVAEPFLLLHMSDGRASILAADPAEGTLSALPDPAGRLAAKTSKISACSLYADTSSTLAPDSAGDQAMCLVCRGSGLEILRVPSLEPLLSFTSASAGLPIMDSSEGEALVDTWLPSIAEVAMAALHDRHKASPESQLEPDASVPRAAYLTMLLSDGTLLIYKPFRRPSRELCFLRMQLQQALLYEALPAVSGHRSAHIKAFDNIADGADAFVSGIFIGGKTPLWLVASRGTLVAHIMDCEGAVAGFTPFHNIGCPYGFFTACTAAAGGQVLKMCRMPQRLRLDTPWPTVKAGLRATPAAVTFSPELQLYAVLVTRQMEYKPWMEEDPAGDRDPVASHAYAVAEAAAKAAGASPTAEIRVMQPGLWQQPVWREPLLQGELPCCLAAAQIRDMETEAMQPLLIAGTAFLLGEDCPCTGRVVLFQLTQANGRWQGKVASSREVRGPVLDIAVLDGVILAAAGTRLEVLELRGSTLQRTAFYDAQILLRSVSVIKDYILLGDVHKSLTFVQSSQRSRQLNELSKDYNNLDVDAVAFLRSGRKLYFLACDRGQSCHLFCYDPSDPQSYSGKRLIAVGRVHIGQTVCSRLPLRVTPADKQAPPLLGALLGTFSGSICCVSPVWDGLPATALLALQQELGFSTAQHAGLNPISFRKRHVQTPKVLGGGQRFEPPLRRINDTLDADLLAAYMWLPLHQQESLATRCAVTRPTLIQAVLQLIRAVHASPQQN